jgi:anti-sigma-K factor RskA
MEPQRVDELIAGYALDSLSGDDERELEEYLRRSPEAREHLAALQETAASLAFGVEAPAPSASLRERILEQSEATEQPSKIVPLRRRLLVPALTAAAAAAAGVAIGLGIWGADVSSSLSEEQAAAARQRDVLALFTQPGSSTYGVDGANGALVVSSGGQAGLVLAGVEKAPEGKTYQAWVIDGGTPTSAGLFDGGSAQTVVPLTEPVPAGATVAVTVEPAGGVDAPTSDPVLAAPTT